MSKSSTQRQIWNRPIRLFLDFDGTITHSDTLATLASIGYAHQKRHAGSRPEPMPWSLIVDAYLRDFEAHSLAYRPERQYRTSLPQERAWLRSLKPVEEASANRALEGRVWTGVVASEVDSAADEAIRKGEVKCRDGWRKLVQWVKGWNGGFDDRDLVKVDVLSVNWSRRFVWACLEASARDSRISNAVEDLSDDEVCMGIYANELPTVVEDNLKHPAERNQPLGADCVLRTSKDKLEQMLPLTKHTTHDSGNTAKEEQDLVIYIGDSTTDLECLVEADIGICIRDEPMGSSQRDLAETCMRTGLAVRHIGEMCGDNIHSLFWTNDFNEVKTFLQDRTRI